MDSLLVECLQCGSTRFVRRTVFRRLDCPECPRCGYVGWAPMLALTESERTELRELPLELRRLSPVG